MKVIASIHLSQLSALLQLYCLLSMPKLFGLFCKAGVHKFYKNLGASLCQKDDMKQFPYRGLKTVE